MRYHQGNLKRYVPWCLDVINLQGVVVLVETHLVDVDSHAEPHNRYLYIYLAETFRHMANSSRNSSTIWCKLITISSVLRASSLVSIGQVLVFLPLFNNRLRISYAHRSFALVSDFLLASRIRFISTIFDHVRGLSLLYAVLILSK